MNLSSLKTTLSILLLILALLIPFSYFWGKRYVLNRELRELVIETKSYVRKLGRAVAKQKSTRYPNKNCGCTKHHLNFRKDPYNIHRVAAKELSNGNIIRTVDELAGTDMVRVDDGLGFSISKEKMTHSEPYLHRKAYSVLLEIGLEFDKRLQGTKAEGSKILISSLTRTIQQQKDLGKQNGNATKGISAHSYGAAFDVYNIETKSACSIARSTLNSLLIDFQNKGKILLCPEGGCIHVTVI